MDDFPGITDSPALDFTSLRAEGITLLQRLAGHRWTDHNTHDPGITVLDQVCYALTDLIYRTGFSVPDLMAEGKTRPAWSANFQPGPMLSAGPLTLRDWRKVLVDTEGVRNAWIFPLDTTTDAYDARLYYDPVEDALQLSPPFRLRDTDRSALPQNLRGLYRVIFIPGPNENVDYVKKAIRRRLLGRRNLCEDFHRIEALESKGIRMEARVEIDEVSDRAALLARIYYAVYSYMAPRIRFYTLQERLAAGHTPEDILEGPLLDHGFIDDREIDAFQLRRSLRISDIIRLIMELEGVRAVQFLHISIPDTDIIASTENRTPWEMIVPDNFYPELLMPAMPSENTGSLPGVQLWKSGLPLRVSWTATRTALDRLFAAEKAGAAGAPLLPPTQGRNRQVALYQSIQHQFPEIYGIGELGLPQSATPLRKAQARQFKAYLSLFDQLLANSFAQLGGAGALFSLEKDATKRMYFSLALRGEIPEFEPLIHWEAFGLSAENTPEEKEEKYTAAMQKLAEGEDADKLWERRNRLLNHLLARFGEEFTEYDPVLKSNQFDLKENLLGDYAPLSSQRGKAFDYARPFADPNNVSGLERRLALLLGFSPERRRLSALNDPQDRGGFYLVEHILLRPDSGDKDQNSPILKLPFQQDENSPQLTDPFSLQLSFILPDWLDRFNENKNPGFRTSVRKTLREETPAHLRIYIHWLNKTDMEDFEATYEQWIEQLNAREV